MTHGGIAWKTIGVKKRGRYDPSPPTGQDAENVDFTRSGTVWARPLVILSVKFTPIRELTTIFGGFPLLA
jgi:hypothetical protein